MVTKPVCSAVLVDPVVMNGKHLGDRQIVGHFASFSYSAPNRA